MSEATTNNCAECDTEWSTAADLAEHVREVHQPNREGVRARPARAGQNEQNASRVAATGATQTPTDPEGSSDSDNDFFESISQGWQEANALIDDQEPLIGSFPTGLNAFSGARPVRTAQRENARNARGIAAEQNLNLHNSANSSVRPPPPASPQNSPTPSQSDDESSATRRDYEYWGRPPRERRSSQRDRHPSEEERDRSRSSSVPWVRTPTPPRRKPAHPRPRPSREHRSGRHRKEYEAPWQVPSESTRASTRGSRKRRRRDRSPEDTLSDGWDASSLPTQQNESHAPVRGQQDFWADVISTGNAAEVMAKVPVTTWLKNGVSHASFNAGVMFAQMQSGKSMLDCAKTLWPGLNMDYGKFSPGLSKVMADDEQKFYPKLSELPSRMHQVWRAQQYALELERVKVASLLTLYGKVKVAKRRRQMISPSSLVKPLTLMLDMSQRTINSALINHGLICRPEDTGHLELVKEFFAQIGGTASEPTLRGRVLKMVPAHRALYVERKIEQDRQKAKAQPRREESPVMPSRKRRKKRKTGRNSQNLAGEIKKEVSRTLKNLFQGGKGKGNQLSLDFQRTSN